MAGTLLEEHMTRVNQQSSSASREVSVRTIERLLLRHTINTSPEVRLIVAMICHAITDLRSSYDLYRRSARHFLEGRDLDHWASMIGLEPDFVREVILKTGHLTPMSLRHEAPSKKPQSQVTPKPRVLPTPPMEPFIDARKAAAALNLPTKYFTQSKVREARKVPFYHIGRCIRFRLSELTAWVQENHQPGNPETTR